MLIPLYFCLLNENLCYISYIQPFLSFWLLNLNINTLLTIFLVSTFGESLIRDFRYFLYCCWTKYWSRSCTLSTNYQIWKGTFLEFQYSFSLGLSKNRHWLGSRWDFRVISVLVKRGKRRTRKAEQLKSKYEQLNGIFSKAMYEDNCYPEAEQRMV